MRDLEAEQLLARIQEHDQGAIMAFYDRYFGMVAGFCRKILTGTNASVADEAIQDTFWYVWQHADRFDASKAALTTWLYIISRSRCLDVLRREKSVEDVTEILPESERGADDEPLVTEVLGRLEQTRLSEAIQNLPPPQEDVIRKIYLLGYTAREVAESQNISLGTIKTRLRLALDKLRGLMEEEVGADES